MENHDIINEKINISIFKCKHAIRMNEMTFDTRRIEMVSIISMRRDRKTKLTWMMLLLLL